MKKKQSPTNFAAEKALHQRATHALAAFVKKYQNEKALSQGDRAFLNLKSAAPQPEVILRHGI